MVPTRGRFLLEKRRGGTCGVAVRAQDGILNCFCTGISSGDELGRRVVGSGAGLFNDFASMNEPSISLKSFLALITRSLRENRSLESNTICSKVFHGLT